MQSGDPETCQSSRRPVSLHTLLGDTVRAMTQKLNIKEIGGKKGSGFLAFSHMLITGHRSTSHAIHFPLMRRDPTDPIFAPANEIASFLKVLTVHVMEKKIIR